MYPKGIGGAGFDCVLLDTEHTPTDVPRMLHHLHAVSGRRWLQRDESAGTSEAPENSSPRDQIAANKTMETLMTPSNDASFGVSG